MVLLPSDLQLHLPDPALFFSRGEPDDPRLGELVYRGHAPAERRPDVLIVGVPHDIGVRHNSGRPGAAEAPTAIRAALYRLTPETWGEHSLAELCIVDVGDLVLDGADILTAHAFQQRCVAALLQSGSCTIVLGGGHDIAYPNAAALFQQHECGILVFDAHPDVRPRRNSLPHSGSAFRQLLDELRFPPHRVAYIGLQPFVVARAHRQYLQERGVRTCTLEELRARGIAAVLPELFGAISDGGRLPVYVSIDLDAVPAAFAPGVSAPATVGITPEELLWAAHFVGARPNVCLMDIAELNPRYDVDNRTARLAALLIATFLAGMVQRVRLPGGNAQKS